MSLRDQLLTADTPAEIADVIDQYVRNELARVQTNPSTGLQELWGPDGVIDVGGADPLTSANAPAGGYGTILAAWTIAPSDTTNASRITDLSVTCPDTEYGNYIAKLDGNASSNATYTHIPAAAIDNTGIANIGFWAMATARADGQLYSGIKFILAASTTDFNVFGVAERINVKADGRWRFYVMSKNSFGIGAGAWTWETAVARIRIKEADGITGRAVMAVGESVYVGPFRKSPRGRAIGMVRFDDNLNDLYTNKVTVNAFTGNSGVNVSAGTYNMLELVTAFGFRATCYVLTDTVGEPGFESVAGLQALQSAGWDIAFQSKSNPISNNLGGIRLLGPIGYNMIAVGGIASVDTSANTMTVASGTHMVQTSANGSGTAVQPFPVEFTGTDLPAPLVAGTKYYLSNANSPTNTQFKVHTTAAGSVTATDIVDLTTTGTVANFGVRYWGSANDYTAILADFTGGRQWLQDNGFTAHEHYALNQGAWDIYSEAAYAESGFLSAWGTAPTSSKGLSIAAFETAVSGAGETVAPTSNSQIGCSRGSWMNIQTATQTDGSQTESNVRTYVRTLCAYGLVGGNFHHAGTTANVAVLLAYLDELKLQSDRGMIDVLTISEYQARKDATIYW